MLFLIVTAPLTLPFFAVGLTLVCLAHTLEARDLQRIAVSPRSGLATMARNRRIWAVLELGGAVICATIAAHLWHAF